MRQSGFTLVELLVTMSIAAVLAAVAVPRFTDAVSKAKATEVQMAFSVIAKAQHIHYMETDRYAMASTPEEYLATLGVQMNDYKHFTFVTGPEYQQLVAIVEIDGIPMVEDGFWVDGSLKHAFGKLDGDEVVSYDYCLSTGEEKASAEDVVMAHYLQNYLFKINGSPVPVGDLAMADIGGGTSPNPENVKSDNVKSEKAPSEKSVKSEKVKSEKAPSEKSVKSEKVKSEKVKSEKAKSEKAKSEKAKSEKAKSEKDDNGHGNDADGFDESNPGKSTGTNKKK